MSTPSTVSLKTSLSVTELAIDAITLDPRNPRLHSERQIKQIARSIENFGIVVPITIDHNHKVLAGHGRVLACRKLGLQQIPVIRIDHLSAAQANAFMIADNRLTEHSTWDEQLLGTLLGELAELDVDFSLEATGFTMGEIDLRIEGLSASPEKQADPDDAVEPIAAEAVSKAGDLWKLDRHYLYCGNALEENSYTSLLQGKQADLVFTDPPYNVKIDGHVSGLGKMRHREFAMASGEMTKAGFTEFLTNICKMLASHSEDGSIHFVCMDWRHAEELLTAGNQVYASLKNICVWVKDNGGMGSLYRSRHELVFVFKHGKAAHRNNVQLGQYGRYRTNVWEYAGSNSFSRKQEEGDEPGLHPTVKPVSLVADAILDCSQRGDIVLDCFLGSGTTLLAAERMGRSCYGMELDPLYVDLAIRRWQRQFGNVAVHVATGVRFDAIAAEARHAG